jgi:alpha-1,2-mannosyltransferase
MDAAVPRSFVASILVVATLVTLGVAVQQRYRVTLAIDEALGSHTNDFDRWMIMAPRFLHDRVDYNDDKLPTPPLSLLVLAPFTALSRPAAQFLWVCLKLPLACLVLALSAGIASRSAAPLTASALALILLCWWLPVVLDMQEGQMNLLVLLPLVAALYVVQQGTRASDALAGFLIGLAMAFKVTPVIFAVYFVWKRRWRVAMAAIASAALWSLVVPAIAFGWDQNLRWLEQWVGIMIVPYLTHGKVVYAMSQSFGSFALRLLSPVPAFVTIRNGVELEHHMNALALSQGVVYQIVRGVMCAVAVTGLVWSRHQLATLRCPRYLMEIGGVAAFMLWFSERTWVHHYVSFVLMLCAAGAILSDPTQPGRTRRMVRAALVLFSVATIFASDVGRIFGPDGVDWAKSAGVFLWPSVLVTLSGTGPWVNRHTRVAVAERLPVFRYYSPGLLSPPPRLSSAPRPDE